MVVVVVVIVVVVVVPTYSGWGALQGNLDTFSDTMLDFAVPVY